MLYGINSLAVIALVVSTRGDSEAYSFELQGNPYQRRPLLRQHACGLPAMHQQSRLSFECLYVGTESSTSINGRTFGAVLVARDRLRAYRRPFGPIGLFRHTACCNRAAALGSARQAPASKLLE